MEPTGTGPATIEHDLLLDLGDQSSVRACLPAVSPLIQGRLRQQVPARNARYGADANSRAQGKDRPARRLPLLQMPGHA
jgi:hypothetical protein